jgi:hypothetical protein
MRWAGQVEHIGEMKNAYIFRLENIKGKQHLGDVGVDEKIILEWNLGKYGEKVWTGRTWLRIGTSGGPLETR